DGGLGVDLAVRHVDSYEQVVFSGGDLHPHPSPTRLNRPAIQIDFRNWYPRATSGDLGFTDPDGSPPLHQTQPSATGQFLQCGRSVLLDLEPEMQTETRPSRSGNQTLGSIGVADTRCMGVSTHRSLGDPRSALPPLLDEGPHDDGHAYAESYGDGTEDRETPDGIRR